MQLRGEIADRRDFFVRYRIEPVKLHGGLFQFFGFRALQMGRILLAKDYLFCIHNPLSSNVLICRAVVGCWILRAFLWTLVEYGMHRILFHVDEWLPDNRWFLTAHFLLHGVHHYLPTDRCT